MLYEQFVQEAEKLIRMRVGDECSVYIHAATKNNGLIRKGITIAEKGINVSPTIYLEEFYERYVECEDMSSIIDQIVELYHNVRVQESWECDFVSSFEGVRDRIVVRLINREANRNLLEEVPYFSFMDLAIVFHVLIQLDEYGEHMATMLIKNEHLDSWNVRKQDLYLWGIRNSERLLPSELSGMRMILHQFFSEDELTGEEEYMYVLTNQRRTYGASTMLYKEQLENIGRLLKDSFYILPSSVHELIIVPASKAVDEDKLQEIVFDINHTQVADEEILSDNIYFYDYKAKKSHM